MTAPAWEYLAVEIAGPNDVPKDTTDALNAFGSSGWELVAVIPRGPENWSLALMKRISPNN